MKKEQKQELESELEKLISAQSAVEQEHGRHRLVAMKNRSDITANIINLFEAWEKNTNADPHTGLRRCA